jgi:hypothetical protein
MKTKFYGNTSKDERRTLRMAARYKLAERKYDLLTYMNWGIIDCDTLSIFELEPGEIIALDEFYERNGSLDKYWVRSEVMGELESGNGEPYLSLILTDTVPIEEIRIYAESDKVEYLYLDWSKGVALTITDEEWAKWLREIVVEMGLLGEGGLLSDLGVRKGEGVRKEEGVNYES